MYCPKCGKEIPDQVKACIFCGHDLSLLSNSNKKKLDITGSTPFNPEGTPTNTSGMGANTIVPEEFKGWSWVGFLWSLVVLPWVWGWTYLYRIDFFFPVLVTVISLISAYIFGTKGKEWAWRNKHWKSINQFKLSRVFWVILWFIFMTVSSVTVYYTINRTNNARVQDNLAKDSSALEISSSLAKAIDSYYLVNNFYPWDEEIPIPDYFTTNVGKEVWLAKLVAENLLSPSSIPKINNRLNLILFNDSNIIRICFIPKSIVNKTKALGICQENGLPLLDTVPLCKPGFEYQCISSSPDLVK